MTDISVENKCKTRRSLNKNNQTEKMKKERQMYTDEVYPDSDNENKLVIDLESTPDWDKPIKDQNEGENDRKHMTLRPKPQNNSKGKRKLTLDLEDSDNGHVFKGKKNKMPKTKVKHLRSVKQQLQYEDKTENALNGVAEKITFDDEGVEVQQAAMVKNEAASDTGNECPICYMHLQDTHSFTLHIREHNTVSNVCQICNKKLSSASSLDRHMFVHSKERPFKCEVCGMNFTTNGNMNRHKRTHESASASKPQVKNGKRGFRQSKKKQTNETDSSNCNSSENSMDSNNLAPSKVVNYNPKDAGKKFLCPVCGKAFLTMDNMQSHIDLHPNDSIRCQTCGVLTENHAVHRDHVCTPVNATVVNNNPHPDKGPDPNKRPVANDNPDNSKLGFYDLSFGPFSVSKFSHAAKFCCENQKRRPTSEAYAFECRVCSKAFPTSNSLCLHEKTHKRQLHLYCQTCRTDFLSLKKYRLHQVQYHRFDTYCNAVTDGMEQENLESRGEDFMTSLGLLKRKTYENMKYYEHRVSEVKQDHQAETSIDSANITSIISPTSNTLLISNMRASPLTATPAFPPQDLTGSMPKSPIIEGSADPTLEIPSTRECGGSASAKSDIENETDLESPTKEIHNNKQFPQAFPSPNALKKLKRSYPQAAKIHKCEHCPYESVDKSTLSRHLRTHNGERPFKCNICDTAFTTKANSHRHVKKKHTLSTDQEVADAVIYNPNMLEAEVSKNIPNDINSSETVCKYCNHDFRYNRVLRHHLRSLNNCCSNKPYSCANCKLGFSTKNNCIRHISNQHPEYKNRIKELVVVNVVNANEEKECPPPSMESPMKETLNDDAPAVQPLNLSLNESLEPISYCFDNDSEDIPGSDAETVSAAQSLVSLSKVVPPQEKPLDLTLCALDLSSRNDLSMLSIEDSPLIAGENCTIPLNENNSEFSNFSHPAVAENVTSESSVEAESPSLAEGTSNLNSNICEPINLVNKSYAPVCLVKEVHIDEHSQSNIIPNTLSLVCLSQAFSPISGLISNDSSLPKLIFSSTPNTLCLPAVTHPTANTEKNCIVNFKLVKEKLTNNPSRAYTCNYCPSKFTLKSNKVRHIKRKHPEYARPTRSRNFIPTLSTTSLQKQSVPSVSNKTRDALRNVLNSKANSTVKPPMEISAVDPVLTQDVFSPGCNGQTQHGFETVHCKSSSFECSGDSLEKTDEDNADLASVSSVINTANSQGFKQYLIDAKEGSNSDEIDAQSNQLVIDQCEDMDHTDVPLESNNEDAVSKKKSSYANCQRSIHCKICERKFPWKSSLSRHTLTHTGAKPHACHLCPVGFSTKSNRDRHLNRKHSCKQHTSSPSVTSNSGTLNSCPSSSSFTDKTNMHFYVKNAAKPNSNKVFSKLETVIINDVTESDQESVATSTDVINNQKHKPKRIQRTPLGEGTSKNSPNNLIHCYFCTNTYKKLKDQENHMKESHFFEYDLMKGKEVPEATLVSNLEVKSKVVNSACNVDLSSNVSQANNSNMGKNSHSSAQSSKAKAKHQTTNTISSYTFSPKKLSDGGNKLTHQIICQVPDVNGPKEGSGSKRPKNSTTLPKCNSNSLLYLFEAAEQVHSVPTSENNQSQGSNSTQSVLPSVAQAIAGKESDLISELLNIQDPQVIDDMLNSAALTLIKKEVDN